MWFWRQNVHKRFSFWSKLAGVSACAHAVVLFLVFFVYHGMSQFHCDIMQGCINSAATVMLMPLHKVAPEAMGKGCKSALPTKVAAAKPAQSAHKEKHAKLDKKPDKKPTTAIVHEKPLRLAHKKNNRKNTKKNKKAERLLAQAKVEPQPEVVAVAQVPPETLASETQDELQYVGRAQLEALQAQQEIQQEIERVWQPPSGMAKELTCQIKIVIDWQGNIQDVAVAQASGVLVYDLHARNAARAVTFPKMVWGKEVVLDFKQG